MARGRQKININKEELQNQVNILESGCEFSTISELAQAVAATDWAKKNSITPSVVLLRFKEFGIKFKVKSTGKRGVEKLEVSHQELQNQVDLLEKTQEFATKVDLIKAVSETDWAKNFKPKPLSESVILLRFKEFGINFHVKPESKKGKERLEVNKQEFQTIVDQLEGQKSFNRLADLWQAVEKTHWAKEMEPRPLTASVAGLRAQELGITTLTQSKKRRRKDINAIEENGSVVEPILKMGVDSFTKRNAGIPRYIGVPLIVVPAGDCPHKLTDVDYDSVHNWCKKVVQTMSNEGKQIAPTGLGYFAGQFFNVFGPEYKEVVEHIQACKLDIYEDETEEVLE